MGGGMGFWVPGGFAGGGFSRPPSSGGTGGGPPLTGLQFWFKGDVGVTGTTNCSAWANQAATGSSYDVTQGTSSAQPTIGTYTLNGIPGLTFDGGDTLDFSGDGLAFLNGAPGLSVFFLIRHAASTGNHGIFSASRNNSNTNRYVALISPTNRWGSADRGETSNTFSFVQSADGALVAGNAYVLSAVLDLGADTQIIYRNGVQLAAGTCDTGATFAASNSQGMRFGNHEGGSFYNGTLFEVLGYNIPLSAEDRQAAEQYLMNRGGLT